MTPTDEDGCFDIEGGSGSVEQRSSSISSMPAPQISPTTVHRTTVQPTLSPVVHRTINRNNKKRQLQWTRFKPPKSASKVTAERKVGLKLRFIHIPGLVMRMSLFVVAIVFCIGSQFHVLRNLHEATGSNENTSTPSQGVSLLRSWMTGIPPKGYPQQRLLLSQLPPQPDPVVQPQQQQRLFGTGLLNRIQEESLRSKTTTTSSGTATRTRTVGATANRKMGKIRWPVVLQQQQQSQQDQSAPKGSIFQTRSADTTAVRTRTMGTVAVAAAQRVANGNTDNHGNPRAVWPVLKHDQDSKAAGATSAIASSAVRHGVESATDVYSKPTTGTNSGTITTTTIQPPPHNEVVVEQPLGSYKIVGFTDYNFREVALKWYQRLEDLGCREHVLVVYDNAVADYLESLNDERAYELNRTKSTEATTNTVHGNNATTTTEGSSNNNTTNTTHYHYRFEKHLLPPLSKTVLQMQRYKRNRKIREMKLAWRWNYVSGQLQAGTSILLSNVDAFFRLPPDLRDYPDFSTFDVIHSYDGKLYENLAITNNNNHIDESQNHFYPNHHQFLQLQDQLGGFTVSSGLTWLKSTPSTIAFVRKLVNTCGIMCDDHQILNEMVARPRILGIEWDDENNDNNTDQTKDDSIRGGGDNKRRFRSSRTGRSTVTGHRFRIWDRNRVFVGDPEHPDELPCPTSDSDIANNWIALPPALDPAITSSSKALDHKLAWFDAWDSNSNNNVEGCAGSPSPPPSPQPSPPLSSSSSSSSTSTRQQA